MSNPQVTLKSIVTKNLTQEPTRKSRQTDASQKASTDLEGIVIDWCSFEDSFFKKGFYLGEHRLDKSLRSLLHLDEACEVKNFTDGRTVLYNKKSIRLNALRGGRAIKERFQTLSRDRNFDHFDFGLKNGFPLDTITGEFPVIFNDYRRVIHCLRMAWAFYLTMKMKKMDKFSFAQRIRTDCTKYRAENHLSCIFIHLYSSLRRENIEDEVKIIKCLKNSLCRHVSQSFDQEELPEGDHINLVPLAFRGEFNKLGLESRSEFFFSLLQSKCLCKEVPEEFILDALIKHRNQLTVKPDPISEETLLSLRQRGRAFGRNVAKFYKPNRGFLPSNKATFEFSRNVGGQKGDLVYHGRLKNQIQAQDPLDRMEPFVIGLFGQPGMGKSTALPQLIGHLASLFPGVKREDMTYSRSCNTKHWDGYRNQPIVILDDLGQSKEGEDIKEFQTLVSCSPYIPPMADLSEKGNPFNSPIIIATSNLQYAHPLHTVYKDQCGILDDSSFWRRFHVPLYIEDRVTFKLKKPCSFVRTENLLKRKGLTRNVKESRSFDRSEQYYQRKPEHKTSLEVSERYSVKDWEEIDENKFYLGLLSLYRERCEFHDNYRQTWTQVIDSKVETPTSLISEEYFREEINPHLPKSLGFDMDPQIKSNTYSLEFPAFPPCEPSPVRVEPITEPLKVRTITAGKGDNFCLKPFQRAMWQALGMEGQFCLTHGTNNLEPAIRKIYDQSSSEDVWISGDYTAATDSIPIEVTKALMEGILESIDHEPTKRWAMKEISPHILVYPKKYGIEPALQQSGQLMGSLMSFPLLCLLNDCTAKAIGLKSSQYLINGDDILMRTKAGNYPIWKKKVREFGLSLSLGKNYIHKDYGTVNSQLIKRDVVTDSGKQKVLDRRVQNLGETLRDLEIMMRDTPSSEVQELFKSVNRSKLSRTIRSIRVPVSHGGLAFGWGDRDHLTPKSLRTEVMVYYHDLFKKIKPDKGCLAIPYMSVKTYNQSSLDEMDRAFNDPVVSKEYHEDFIGPAQIKIVEERLKSNAHLRELFLNQRIEDLPPLSFLSTIQVPFSDVRLKKKIQSEIDKVFFLNFIDPNRDYTYELFRSHFLQKVRGIPGEATEVATKFLVPILDLHVQPDYLLKVVKGYTVQEFDQTHFEGNLTTLLQPKSFDLPKFPESENFALEVIDSFRSLNQLKTEEDLDNGRISLDELCNIIELTEEEILLCEKEARRQEMSSSSGS